MPKPTRMPIFLGLIASLSWSQAVLAQPPISTPPAQPPAPKVDKKAVAALVPIEELPEAVREKARGCLDKPTLFTPGQPETFQCNPSMYFWILDHPDRAVLAWQRLGATVMPISDRGNGKFGWSDELGSDVVWDTIYRSPGVRVWFAEGKVKPGKLMPFVPVKAMVVLRHAEVRDAQGRTFLAHQAHMFIQADNQAMALATKIFGAATPKLAEQSVSQMQMFFGGLAWYLERHPEQAEDLLVGPTGFDLPIRQR